MKLSGRAGRLAALMFAVLLAGCAATPMSMKSTVEPSQAKRIGSVLIVTNGDLFPESSRQVLFDPAVDALKEMFAESGIKSWNMALDKRSLNPGAVAAANARQLGASHLLFVSAARVASFGPRNATTDYGRQQRLISSYELGFVLADVAAGRNVWKGELASGSEIAGGEEEVRAVRGKVQESLRHAGFLHGR